jgi:oxalate decarboxylase
VFRASEFQDVSLADWMARTPPALVAQHLNVSQETIEKFPRSKPEIVPL